MYSPLKQFLVPYLSIVFAAILSVGFYAFLAIPYSLGGHPGDAPMAKAPIQAATPSTTT